MQKKKKKNQHCALWVSNFIPWIECFHLMGIRWLKALSIGNQQDSLVFGGRCWEEKNTLRNHNTHGLIESGFT